MAKRVDANQKEIVSVFRKMGASVLILSMVGKGCPDLCLGLRNQNFLIEIKDGNKPPSARRLTEDENIFFKSWKGQVILINSIDEAIQFINSIS